MKLTNIHKQMVWYLVIRQIDFEIEFGPALAPYKDGAKVTGRLGDYWKELVSDTRYDDPIGSGIIACHTAAAICEQLGIKFHDWPELERLRSIKERTSK